MIIGQIEQMKMAQIAAGLAALNSSSPSGSLASGDTGRSRLTMGENMALIAAYRPMANPTGMPITAASPKPIATRSSDASRFQPMPLSLGPLS
ncbi:hypothetical protein G6F63_014238 [Rhizopus arrhizus]|nr:hypothetical protein G6F63_014238 [Rhizopus arrhizus]